MHIIDKVLGDVPNLREDRFRKVFFDAFREGKEAFGCRLVEFSVLSNHLHYVIEAPDKESLTRFMIGLKVRFAKAINRVAGRKGAVFADRYYREDLASLGQVRNALRYVLCNASKHGVKYEGRVDPCSSGAWFDGWLDFETPLESNSPVAKARGWKLLNWMEHYERIDPDSYKPK